MKKQTNIQPTSSVVRLCMTKGFSFEFVVERDRHSLTKEVVLTYGIIRLVIFIYLTALGWSIIYPYIIYVRPAWAMQPKSIHSNQSTSQRFVLPVSQMTLRADIFQDHFASSPIYIQKVGPSWDFSAIYLSYSL